MNTFTTTLLILAVLGAVRAAYFLHLANRWTEKLGRYKAWYREQLLEHGTEDNEVERIISNCDNSIFDISDVFDITKWREVDFIGDPVFVWEVNGMDE